MLTIDQIKNFREFIVEVDIPEGKTLSGVLPFNATITQNKGRFKIFAGSYEDAKKQIEDYLNN
jgi:hypothetical protein